MEQIVQVSNLTKKVMCGKKEILKNIHFEVFNGDFISIMGKSGAGKSSLLSTIAGIDRSYEGNIVILNRNLNTLNDNELTIFRNQNIGMVFQNFQLISSLNVEENIAVPLYFSKAKFDIKKKSQ